MLFDRFLRIGLKTVLAAAGCLCIAGMAGAQEFPAKPITFIWPSTPGSGSDTIFRSLNSEAAKILGQTIVYENRAGADGRLGLMAVERARGDAYVLSGVTSVGLAVQPLIEGYQLEVFKDYSPVVLLGKTVYVLYASPSVPFRDMKGLMAFGRANPGKINAASQGITALHFGLLEMLAGIRMTVVPYKGESAVVPDLLAGRVDLMIAAGGRKAEVEAGKLLALATTGTERWFLFPNTPTLQEAGVPGSLTAPWLCVVGPPGAPENSLLKLRAAFNSAAKTTTVTNTARNVGIILPATDSNVDEYVSMLKAERALWEPVVMKLKQQGIKMN